MNLEAAQKGIRPADVPKAQEIYGNWRQASLMLQSPKIQKDANTRAEWLKKADDSYAELMSLTDSSKQQSKFEYDMNLEAAKKGFVGYVPANEYAERMKISNSLPLDQVYKQGFNTAVPYMLPAETMPKEDLHVLARGKQLPVLKKYEDVIENGPDGKPVKTGQTEIAVSRYEYTGQPDKIVQNTARYLANIPMASSDAKRSFKSDTEKNGEEWVKGVIQEAQDELDAHPVGGHSPKLAFDFAGYEQANMVLEAKEKSEPTGNFKPDRDYEAAQKEREKKADDYARHMYRMQELGVQHKYRLGEKQFGFSLQQSTQPKNYTVDEIEAVLSKPTGTVPGENGQPPKTYLELGINAMAHLNAATKTNTGGIEMQPLPVFSNTTVNSNEVYQKTIKQTAEKLRSVLQEPKWQELREKLYNPKVPIQQQLEALANAYNDINRDNHIDARFTADDLKKTMPVIYTESYSGKLTNALVLDSKTGEMVPSTTEFVVPKQSINGILKPGTPEFRNKLQYQIDKYGKTLKKGVNSAKVVGAIADMNAGMGDDE